MRLLRNLLRKYAPGLLPTRQYYTEQLIRRAYQAHTGRTLEQAFKSVEIDPKYVEPLLIALDERYGELMVPEAERDGILLTTESSISAARSAIADLVEFIATNALKPEFARRPAE